MLTFDIHFQETFIYAHKGDFFKILTLVFPGILKYTFTSLKISKKNEKKDERNMNNALFLYHKRCQAICSKNVYYCFAWKIQNKNPFSLFFFLFSILSLFSVQDESNVNNALFLYHKRCQAICSKNGYYCFAWKLQNKNPFFLFFFWFSTLSLFFVHLLF